MRPLAYKIGEIGAIVEGITGRILCSYQILSSSVDHFDQDRLYLLKLYGCAIHATAPFAVAFASLWTDGSVSLGGIGATNAAQWFLNLIYEG